MTIVEKYPLKVLFIRACRSDSGISDYNSDGSEYVPDMYEVNGSNPFNPIVT